MDKNNTDSQFSFFHFTKQLDGTFNVMTSSGFPMRKKSRITSIYLINMEFNDKDTISIGKTFTDLNIEDNLFFIRSPLPKSNKYSTLPLDTEIIIRLIVNAENGKFIFSLSDNVKEINDYIEKVKVNVVYKLEDK